MAPRYTYMIAREGSRVTENGMRRFVHPPGDGKKSWRLVHTALVSSFTDREGVTLYENEYIWEHDARDDMAPSEDANAEPIQ